MLVVMYRAIWAGVDGTIYRNYIFIRFFFWGGGGEWGEDYKEYHPGGVSVTVCDARMSGMLLGGGYITAALPALFCWHCHCSPRYH